MSSTTNTYDGPKTEDDMGGPETEDDDPETDELHGGNLPARC